MNETPTNISEPQPNPIQPKQLITAERVLFDTLREYLLHFWKYFIVSAIVLLPLAGFTAWFNPESRAWYLFFPFNFIATLISYYPHIALLFITREFKSNNSVKIGTAYLTSVSIYLQFAWTMIMVLFLSLFGIILCIIPGIIAYVVFCIADGIAVWEGNYGIPAMQRSLALTRKHFWHVLWILIVFDLVLSIGYILISQIPIIFHPEIPNIFSQMFSIETAQTPFPWWYVLYQELIAMIIFPTGAIMTYILYRNLKEVSEQKIELPLNL
jgi:hypothetical protein